jgi:hypothetical protein
VSPHADLRRLVEATGPFLTVTFPIRSDLDDARHRFDIRWKNARREIDDSRWSDETLRELDAVVAGLPHDGGAGLVIVRAQDGTTLIEFVDEPVDEYVGEGFVPRLAPVLEVRQRAIPHVLVETDRAGADIHAFEGGRVLSSEQVEGDTEHIHRGHPGGWSQRRFQQRAENTWERNADDVAEAIEQMDRRVGAELVFVAGEVRARHLVHDALSDAVRDRTIMVEAGSPDGIADEVVRLLSDHVARSVRALAEQVRERLGTGTASADVHDVLAALAEGRVEHLLVHDDSDDASVTDRVVAGIPAGARTVDVAVTVALLSDAEITVVPSLALLDGAVAALLRW